ncbi:MAG: GH3 auxin-responsive promoter family protein [Alphaproteobacteria bacterium]
MSFIRTQQKNLRTLIADNAGSSLYAHLGLSALGKYRDFDMLYQSFTRTAPVTTHASLHQTLQTMTGMHADMAQVLLQPKLTSAQPLLGLSYMGHDVVPVAPVLKTEWDALQARLLALMAEQKIEDATHIFALFNTHPGSGRSPQAPKEIEKHLLRGRTWWGKSKYVQDVDAQNDEARSSHQHMLAFYHQLQKVGKQVHILLAEPRYLTHFALFVARQEGRFVPLKELCPNIKVYCPLGVVISPYRTELAYFFRDLPHLKQIRLVLDATGLLAIQDDINLGRRFTVLPESSSFFEFIPESDVDPSGRLYRNFKRLHAGQIEVGKSYLILISNMAGLTAYNTGWVVKVAEVEPFRFVVMRNLESLNAFGEGVAVDVIARTVQNINDTMASHGMFVRDFMVGANVAKRYHRWVLELSRPVNTIDKTLLKAIAKRVLADMETNVPSYQHALRNGAFHLPEFSFVPVGTFSSMPDTFEFNWVDNSESGEKITAVLTLAAQTATTFKGEEFL